MRDVKYVCVIIDDFTPLALSFPNVQLVDFGATTEVAYIDSYYKNYWSSFSFQDKGDIDGSFLISESLGYGLVDQFFSSTLVDTIKIGPDLRDYSSYYGLYMYEGYEDYYVYRSNLAVASSQANVGHGDWVLESFFQNLKDPESVEVVAVDVDFTTFQDFQYLFSRPQQLGGISVLEYCVGLASNKFFDATNDYLLAGLSASWGGSQVNENIISAVDDLLSYGSFVFQAVANVNQSSIPWGAIEQNVINIGAYNVDRNGYILASDEAGYSYIDLLANGYVERSGWESGWNFGTSFATPRVFASAINFFDERLSPLILTGDIDPIPIGESPPVLDAEMADIVEGLLEEVSTQVNVRLAELTQPVNVRVLSDDIDASINPAQVPVDLSDSGLKFLSATLPDTATPLISIFSPADAATGVAVGSNITVTFNEAIQKGTGNIEIRQGSATGTLVESFAAATSTRLTFSGSTLTIDPTSDLANSTQYFVTFASGSVRDLANNNYAGTSIYDFTTEKLNEAPSFSSFKGIINTKLSENSFDWAHTVLGQDDGKILVAGYSQIGGDFALIRYNHDGSLDADFGFSGKVGTKFGDSGANGEAYDVVLQTDGKILVTGSKYNSTKVNFVNDDDFALVRYESNGTVDTSFGENGRVITSIGSRDIAKSVTVHSDGKILLAGSAYMGSTREDFTLVRYNNDGTLDLSFDLDGKTTVAQIYGTNSTSNESISSVVEQPDGKILISGQSSFGDFIVARLNIDGSLDSSFGTGGKSLARVGASPEVKNTLLLPNGKILLAGFAVTGSSKQEFVLVRYNADGSLDSAFDGDGKVSTTFGGWDGAYAIALQDDSDIYVAGYSGNNLALARYNYDGSLDTNFGIGGKVVSSIGHGFQNSTFGKSIDIQGDGKVLIAGYGLYSLEDQSSSGAEFVIGRFNADGSIDTTFGHTLNFPNTSQNFQEDSAAILLDSDVTIYDTDLDTVGNYAGASVTLQRLGGASNQDQFSHAGSLGSLVEGQSFTVSGSALGTVTKNSGGTLTLTFNSSATQSLVNNTLQGISYRNVSDAPPDSVALGWTFSDGNTGDQGAGGALAVTGSTTIYIAPTNDAPILIANSPTLANVSVRQTNPTGQSVVSFLGNSLSDPDGASPQGIAVHAVSGSAGRWQFRVEGQDTWADVGSVSTAGALLLKSSDFVRFTPDGTATTQASLGYYGWDQSSGVAGSRIDASVRGGITAFSTLSNTATLNVFDAVISSTNYTLRADEYDLELTGTSAIDGTGNVLDNDITGNVGVNTLSGLGGNDTLKGGLGNDVLDGGAGIDTADYSDKTLSVTANLRSPANTFVRVGNVSEDRLTDIENLIGGSGDDALTGNGLVNVLIGGLGDDTLDGGGGADSLLGGAGNDTFVVDQTGDVVVELLGQGADQIRTSLAQIDLNDYDHVENLTYTGRNTSALIGSDADNVIQGGARTDVIQGGLGSDTLYGGDGADVLMGSADDMAGSSSDRDRLLGGRGNDVYLLNGEADAAVQIIEYRGEGTDTVLGDLARYVMTDNVENYVNDRAISSQNGVFQYIEITGNSQNNIIRSAPNWDLIPKTAGLDWVATNINRLIDSTSNFVSNERFFGMAGNDTLLGGAGDDYLSGGAGRDRLIGGSGSDQFVFDAALNRTGNVDIITDFVRGQDKIVLDRDVFSRFSVGENVADHFSATGRPLDRDDYLIYNASTKTLFYDADGSGGGAAVAFAVLTGVNTLSASDFLIM
jgi:uncharacterized delta-60 repeat protein